MRLAQTSSSDSDAQLGLQLLKYETETASSATALQYEATGLRLRVGDWIAFHLKNQGTAPVDVTVLFIDSHYGIQAIYPRRGQEIDQRIPAGKDAITTRFQVVNNTLGAEHAVAIGVTASGPRVSFAMLEQPSLAALRAPGVPRSVLDDLLEYSLYGRGTRSVSLDPRRRSQHVVRMVSWLTIEK
jgi:hypothetical protein